MLVKVNLFQSCFIFRLQQNPKRLLQLALANSLIYQASLPFSHTHTHNRNK